MAAVDYFLKIDGVEGESEDAKHKGSISIESFSWGATQSGTMAEGGGGGAGKVRMQDFHFIMKVNKASPKLMLACASGEHIKKAVLTCRKAGKEQMDFLKISFEDIIISSYSASGAGSADVLPMDSCTFNFAIFEMDYKAQKADGTLGPSNKAGWNLKRNVKV